MKKGRKLALTLEIGLFLVGGLTTLAGCSNSSKNKVTTVTVGTSGAPKPFTYESKGKIKGYDIDTARAVDKLLPGYKFTFKKTEFSSILAGLDSGRFEMGANNFAANAQRQKKYYYSKPIFKDQYVAVVQKNDNSIQKLDDIAGKTTITSPGINFTTALENFNKTASVKTKITYSQEDASKQVQDVEDGKYDYILIDKPLYENYSKTFNFKNTKAIDLDASDTKKISASTPYSYFLISKTPDGKKLLKKVNKAITKIQDNGTAKKISEKYFYDDYVPNK